MVSAPEKGINAPVTHAACSPAAEPISIEITLVHGSLKHDETLSIAQLTEKQRRSTAETSAWVSEVGNPAEFGAPNIGTHTFGAAASKVELSFNGKLTAVSDKCFVVSNVTATFGYADRELRIARETVGDECVYQAVLAHETRHVLLDDQLIDDYQPELRRELSVLLSANGSVVAASIEEAGEHLRGTLAIEGLKIVKTYDLARMRRHRDEIDTPDEYKRFSTSCDGRVQRMMRRSRAGG